MGGPSESDQEMDLSREQLLSERDREDATVVYVRERRTRWVAFATHFTCFVLGILATALAFGITLKLQNSDVSSRYTFAENDALPHGKSRL